MTEIPAILFDFDGVLLESEFEGNRIIAETLTGLGYPHSVGDALKHYVGLNGADFVAAIEKRIGGKVPTAFEERMKEESARALGDGIVAVAGAVEFVRSLPPQTAKAVTSSSSTRWICGHLEHLGLAGTFGEHIYSGREHVTRGKPAPDLYLHAAAELGVPIEDCVILEDSPVGVQGALASGARVIGLVAGAHCFEGHDQDLRRLGLAEIAYSFDEVRELLGLA